LRRDRKAEVVAATIKPEESSIQLTTLEMKRVVVDRFAGGGDRPRRTGVSDEAEYQAPKARLQF